MLTDGSLVTFLSVSELPRAGMNIILVTDVLFYLPSISMKRVDLTFISHSTIPANGLYQSLTIYFQMLS